MRLAAQFQCSAAALADCPRWTRSEVALAGRSNVGKSSLLNILAEQRNLARTSKTPGRTRTLNFFTVAEHLALVDLPGYGYARMARAAALEIARLLEQYLCARDNLAALVLVVDARRGPEEEELALARLAQTSRRQLLLVATKCDKLKSSERVQALRRFVGLGPPLLCSALSGEGIDELRRRILALGALQSSRRTS